MTPDSDDAATPPATDAAHTAGAAPTLWEGDLGTLGEQSRRALLELLQGPYLSGRRRPQLWQALIADEAAIRSRLHDLFLDVVIDQHDEFAFTRRVATDEIAVPAALRSKSMTFLDTAMLLVLRQHLLTAAGERRVIVGRDEVFEQLAVYQQGVDSGWARRLNRSWTKMLNSFSVLQQLEDDRAEVSPVLKVMIGPEEARAFTELYREIAAGQNDDDADVTTQEDDR